MAFALTVKGDLPEGQSQAVPDRLTGSKAARAEHATTHEAADDLIRVVSREERLDAIARAHVWRLPPTPVVRANLAPAGPPRLDCWFRVTELGGTTPKFHCVTDGGRVRVKYGFAAEVPAEAAATQLLTALGFLADHITLVERLRCFGCPQEPFTTMKVVEATRTQALYEHVIDHTKYEEFEWVAIERKLEARAIESATQKGWAFYELDLVDAKKGGAPRVHVDALRLLTVFLAHWDNKAENQRLVCLDETWPAGTECRQPFLLLQDVGATFGPTKLNLDAWQHAPIWEDRPTCTISLKDMPYGGGTFGRARVSERGRRFLAGLLAQLTDGQLTDLFTSARVDQPRIPWSTTRPVGEWVRVFKKRAAAISEGPACPDP